MTELDIPALLRVLAEQQTALLAAHAESMRVQRVLIERLTNTEEVARPPERTLAETSGPMKVASESKVAADAVAQVAPTSGGDRAEVESAGTIATSSEPEPVVAEPAPATEHVSGDRPGLQVVAGSNPGRSDRYYRPATRPQPAPSSVSPQQLNVLRAIHNVGGVGHMVLMFGPHAGETLGQVAQNDLEYIRQLARTALRADVRAAAARLMAAVPLDPPVHRRTTSQRSRGGR